MQSPSAPNQSSRQELLSSLLNYEVEDRVGQSQVKDIEYDEKKQPVSELCPWPSIESGSRELHPSD